MTSIMIRITDTISIDESELEESFVRSSGPGGQNVNKLSTAVQLRFDVRRSPSLPNDVAVRLMRLAGRRLTKDGVLVITAQSHRTQERNRAEARERLVELIREAAVRPVPRRATKPTKASRSEAARGQEAPLRHQEPARGASRRSNSGGSCGLLPRGAPHCADKFERRIRIRPPDARPPAFRDHRQPHRRRRGGRAAGERGQGTGRERARRRRAPHRDR